jgi:hypothetical protein
MTLWVINCPDNLQVARLLCPRKLPRQPFGIEAVQGQQLPHAPQQKWRAFLPWEYRETGHGRAD